MGNLPNNSKKILKLLKRKIFNCEPSAEQKARNLFEIASLSLASMGIVFDKVFVFSILMGPSK
jgi:hypothetical protein